MNEIINSPKHLPPMIQQYFDPYMLLTTLERMKMRFEKKTISLFHKKVRPQDVGKKREFENLSKKFT